MRLSLLVLSPGTRQGKSILIKKAQFVIGRDPDCDLRPASPYVSHRHCAITVRGDQAFVSDFGSTNGTFLNEQGVENERELKNGDQLRIESLLFQVNLVTRRALPGDTPPAPISQPADAKDEAGIPSEPSPPVLVPPADAPAHAASVPPAEEAAVAEDLLLLELADSSPSAPENDYPLKPIEEAGSNTAGAETPEVEQENGVPPKPEPGKASPADTTGAATTILQKYLRRPHA
jgi:predicted component of type VI protein secretion system